MSPQLLSKVATGIHGFDQLSRGGLPRHRTSLVIGGPGTGKTVFALQTLVSAALKRKQLHRLVKGAVARHALAAGQIDAVMDPASGSAILLPQAQAALRRSSERKRANVLRADVPNRLLAVLPAKEFARLRAHLEPVKLTYGDVLYEPGDRMRHVYFPSDCLVSLLTIVERHRALEVGLVGHEGAAP